MPEFSRKRDVSRGKNGFEMVFGCLDGTFGGKGTVIVGVCKVDLDGRGSICKHVKEELGFFVVNGHTGKGMALRLEKFEREGECFEIRRGRTVSLRF